MKKLLVLVAFLASFSLMAFQARVDVIGTGEKINMTPNSKSKGCALSNPGWIKDENTKTKYIYFASPRLKKDAWTEVEFSFTPDKDGKVSLKVGGQWYNSKKDQEPRYVYVKDVQILEGSTLKNGDFAEITEDGSLSDWSYNTKAEKPEVSEEDGVKIVKLQYANGIKQTISVSENVTVKVKITVKSAMP